MILTNNLHHTMTMRHTRREWRCIMGYAVEYIMMTHTLDTQYRYTDHVPPRVRTTQTMGNIPAKEEQGQGEDEGGTDRMHDAEGGEVRNLPKGSQSNSHPSLAQGFIK
jgi:hypothetical protein